MRLELIPVEGLPEVRPGDDLAAMIAERAELRDGDVVVVAQKVVSKAEGQLVDLRQVQPGPAAAQVAATLGDPDRRLIQVILDQSVRIVRVERALIVETKHGYVCANAGVDNSNLYGEEVVSLLPEDSDASAARLRDDLKSSAGAEVGVIVADSFGRPWRMGLTNVALGVAGLPALIDHRGRPDDAGRELRVTVVAIADELAGAAELVMGKTGRVPAVIVRGYSAGEGAGTGRDLLRPAELDLFR